MNDDHNQTPEGSDNKVRPLFPGRSIDAPAANAGAIAAVESVLEMCRGGRVVGVECVVAYSDMTSSSVSGGTYHTQSMLGAMEVLKWDILTRLGKSLDSNW